MSAELSPEALCPGGLSVFRFAYSNLNGYWPNGGLFNTVDNVPSWFCIESDLVPNAVAAERGLQYRVGQAVPSWQKFCAELACTELNRYRVWVRL